MRTALILALCSTALAQEPVAFAAPGRVDVAGGVISVGAAMSGALAAVNVREGERVSAGQTLAVFACKDLSAEVQEASARMEAARQVRNRLLHGSTSDERNEAAARVTGAEATVREARARYQRYSQLAAKDNVSQLELDRTRLDLDAAEASLRTLEHRQAVVNADALPEDLARQDAEIEAAAEHRKTLEERLAMCTIRAPIGGTVLRRPMQPGEMFSLAIPQPIALLADLSHVQIRAEVDERDVGRIHQGQMAKILIAAYPSQSFAARVVQIQDAMGRKNIRTGDPAEKSDRDVLEVLLDLQAAAPKLPLGLRVTVQFLE